MKKLVLVDGHSVVYRSYFAFIRNPLRNSKGENTSAVFGFANTLKKVLKEFKPEYGAVVFDAPGLTFRESIFAQYKAQRPKAPDELKASIPVVKSLVEALGLKVLEVPGIEADDVIGSLANKGREEGFEVIIVSSDKDVLQLVGEGITVYDPYKEKCYRAKDVQEKLGVLPGKVPDFLALAGDAVDNIPGVSGIGPKRALAVLAKYGSLEEALKLDERLKEFGEQLRLSQKLAKIKTDAQIAVTLESLKLNEPDRKRLMEIYREMEFYSFLNELTSEGREGVKIELEICPVDDIAELERISGLPFGFSSAPGKGVWVSPDGNRALFIPQNKHHLIKFLLENKAGVSIGFDIKDTLKELHQEGLDLAKPVFDLGVGAWLLDPNRKGYRPEDVVVYVLGRGAQLSEHSQRAVWAWRVYQALLPELQARGLAAIAETIEMPLIFVLARMEERGVKINPSVFNRLTQELNQEKKQVEKRIYDLAGFEFNIGSFRQLSEVLFERLKLPHRRKTKTGYSTGQDVLTDLRGAHPIVDEVLKYRELDKLLNTYLRPLLEVAHPKTHRIHSKFNQCGTSTGRLTSYEPNLQNIPIKGELGERIRQGFVADSGMMLISADYSQIELRVLAHLSGDERLSEAFLNGEDIHRATAAAILGISLDDVTPEQRRIAKMVNYGLIYGMGDYGLSSRMGIPLEQARAFMEEYFQKFPDVRKWQERIIEEAKRDGLVRTISGRIRPVPGLFSEIRQVREQAIRVALNTPVQGSAADIMKRAMILVHQAFERERFKGGIILQIHDELLIEVEQERVLEARELIKGEMEGAWRLRVPLLVEIGVAKNWGEA